MVNDDGLWEMSIGSITCVLTNLLTIHHKALGLLCTIFVPAV